MRAPPLPVLTRWGVDTLGERQVSNGTLVHQISGIYYFHARFFPVILFSFDNLLVAPLLTSITVSITRWHIYLEKYLFVDYIL